MECERASTKYFQTLFMVDKVGQIMQGVVSGVNQRGVFVELQPDKCEGMIHINDINTKGDFTYDEQFKILISSDAKYRFVIGNKVMIKIKQVNLDKSQIDLVLED
jgi:ribonuclease R